MGEILEPSFDCNDGLSTGLGHHKFSERIPVVEEAHASPTVRRPLLTVQRLRFGKKLKIQTDESETTVKSA